VKRTVLLLLTAVLCCLCYLRRPYR